LEFRVFHQSDDGYRGGGGVGEGDQNMRRAGAGEEGSGVFVEAHEGFLARAVIDGDGMPAEFRADAGGEGFGNGFLRGEAGGEVLVRVAHAEAVGDFAGGENAVEEGRAVAFVRGADARDVHDVRADADKRAALRNGGQRDGRVRAGGGAKCVDVGVHARF